MDKTYLNQCALRRERVFDAIGTDGVAVLFAAPEQRRSNDTFYPYRPDSDVYYLSGFDEPEAVLVLSGARREAVLFCREKNPEREIWDGFRYGVDLAQEWFGFDRCASIGCLSNELAGCLQGHRHLYALWNRYPQQEALLLQTWYGLRSSAACAPQPTSCVDLRTVLHPLRLIKDACELDLLRRAAAISAQGHLRAMRCTRPDMTEYQIEGEIACEFARHGARQVAYASIVAGGKNACTLHYVNNQDTLRDGDLLLIDAGAEYGLYAGDISRTFPVNGRFTAAQRELYQVVLAANKAVIAAARAGVSYDFLGDLAAKILTQGLLDLKLLSGSLSDHLSAKNYRRFYMHGFGHWLGLDVHDVGDRFADGQPVILRENMCLTVEPGLYIPDEPDIPPQWRGVGIRIEDNIIIQRDGAEVYTADAPKEIADIEAVMAA
ncbi:MAG: aminopeptidase P N-terminal domain-containing protein [Neisseria sp.]|nr:aminopeptidase P N-terminal domain-containing protein [Neisseria sp.]